MRKGVYLCLTIGLGLWLPTQFSAAWSEPPNRICEPGFKIIEETCYKDVVKKVCKVVPDVKKVEKWVYDCKTQDFCLPKCGFPSLHGHACGKCAACLQCGHPMSTNVLVKKKVVEEIKTEKCVVETVVERVAYTVFRKIPCGTTGPIPSEPLAMPLPKSPKASEP